MAELSSSMLSQFTDNANFQSEYIYKFVRPKENQKKKNRKKRKEKIYDFNNNAVYEKGGVRLLMTGISVLMESKDIVQVLRKGESPIILKVHDWECQGSNTKMVVAPLVLFEEGCATLDYYCHNKDTELDILFQVAPHQNKYIFSTNMKIFLSECIRLIVAQSEKGVHMKVCAKEILYTKEGYFKLYNLSNRCDSVKESVDSFREIVQALLNAAKLRNLVLAEEVAHLHENCPDLCPQSMYRHPSLLLKGYKLMLIRRMSQCFEEGKIEVIDDPDFVHGWSKKFEGYVHLNEIFDREVSGNSNAVRLVRRLRNVSEHINDYVKKLELRNAQFSPLELHGITTLYSDHDVENIIDILYPKLLSWLHTEAADYSAIKECEG